MRKVQYFNSPADGRLIKVTIDFDEDSVDFEFKKGDNSQWFYDIPINQLRNSPKYWYEHMRYKNWWTPQMEGFISEIVNK